MIKTLLEIKDYIALFILRYNPYKKYGIEGDTYLSDGVWMPQEIIECDSLLECITSNWWNEPDDEYQNLRIKWSERYLSTFYRGAPNSETFYNYLNKIEKNDITKRLKKLEKKGIFKESFFSKKEHELIDESYDDLVEFLDKLNEENYWKNKQDYIDLSYAVDVIHDFYYRTK
tara:strand:+ start:222 stop:740 length:519 start_codon:yes stop_codon:yes gene_type:complete